MLAKAVWKLALSIICLAAYWRLENDDVISTATQGHGLHESDGLGFIVLVYGLLVAGLMLLVLGLFDLVEAFRR